VQNEKMLLKVFNVKKLGSARLQNIKSKCYIEKINKVYFLLFTF